MVSTNQLKALEAVLRTNLRFTEANEDLHMYMQQIRTIFSSGLAAYFIVDSQMNFRLLCVESEMLDSENEQYLRQWKSESGLLDQVLESRQVVWERQELRVSVLPWKRKPEKFHLGFAIISMDLFGIRTSVRNVIVLGNVVRTPDLEFLVGILQKANGNSLQFADMERTLYGNSQFINEVANLDLANLELVYKQYFESIMDILSAKFASLWISSDFDGMLILRGFYPEKIYGSVIDHRAFHKSIIDVDKDSIKEVVDGSNVVVYDSFRSNLQFKDDKFISKNGLDWTIVFPIRNQTSSKLILVLYPDIPKISLENVNLGALHRRINALSRVLTLSSSIFDKILLQDFDDFMDSMLTFKDERKYWDDLCVLISDKMQCEACSIFLKKNQDLVLTGTTGIQGDPPYEYVIYRLSERTLTTFAFEKNKPLIYYFEERSRYKDIHRSKYREKFKKIGPASSNIFMTIRDSGNHPIGIIRCVNKIELGLHNYGVFSKEDVDRMQKIAQVISNILIKVANFRDREIERERNLNSLHHELMSPIDGIISHVEWFEVFYLGGISSTKSRLAERAKVKFDDIKKTSRLVELLVSTFGKISDINISQFSPMDLLQTCISYCYNEAKNRDLEVRIGWFPSVMKGDEILIMRVFYNLLRNAIKYVDIKQAYRYIFIDAKESDSQVIITFEDNGVGVDQGEESLIFSKFRRGRRASHYYPEGTGLGLSFCREILNLHGGTIFFSNNSKPTTVQLNFPKHNK